MTINKIETLIVPDTPKLLLKQEIRVFAPVDEFTKVTSGGILLKRFDADTKLDKLLGPAANMTYLYSSRYTQDGDVKHDLVEVYSDYASPLSIVQRTSTGNIVTVNATEDNHAVPFGQYYAGITNLQNNKASFEDLVTLSSNLNNVVTEFKEDVNNQLDEQEQKLDLELAEVKSEVNTIVTNVTESLKRDVEDNTFNINVLKRVLVETGDIVPIVVEDAYISRETAAGKEIFDEQLTDVLEIKGSTVSCKNLIPYHNDYDCGSSGSQDGVDYTVNADGSITLNGAPTKSPVVIWLRYDIHAVELEVGKTYRINPTNINDVNLIVQSNDYLSNIGFEGTVATHSRYMVYLSIYSGVTLNNTTIYPMLYEGTEEKPYQPYFTGLKHAYIDSIKSTGRNLIDHSTYTEMPATYSGVTFTKNADGSVRVKGLCNDDNFVLLTERLNLYPNYQYTLSGYQGDSDGDSRLHIDFGYSNSYDDFGYGGTFVVPTNYNQMRLYFHISNGVTYDTTLYPMINRGTTALPYGPYTEETYQLPQTLDLPEFDRFNPQTGELVKATKEIVITGEEPRWSFSGGGTSEARFGHDGLAIGAVGGAYRLSNKDILGIARVEIYSGGWVDVYDTRYNSVEEWTNYLKSLNAAGTPLRIAYKSETPTTETIANVSKGYKVHNHGNETVNQGATDNSKFGAMPTITNEYIALLEVTDE